MQTGGRSLFFQFFFLISAGHSLSRQIGCVAMEWQAKGLHEGARYCSSPPTDFFCCLHLLRRMCLNESISMRTLKVKYDNMYAPPLFINCIINAACRCFSFSFFITALGKHQSQKKADARAKLITQMSFGALCA